jgi:hypothetical protein
MQATINTIVNAYNTFLKAGGNFGEQMRAVAQSNTPQPALIEALAQATAKHFKCHAKMSNRGAWSFYTDSDTSDRHEGARTAWKRHVKPWIKPESKPVVRKQVDKIEVLSARLQKQLSKRDLTRLVKLLANA